MKSYIAEALGTCMFATTIIIALALGPWVGSVIAAFVLMFVVYGVGSVSGAHINPAITIGALSIGKIKPLQALNYIIAQIAGAALAIVLLHYFNIASPANASVAFSSKVLLAEIIGTAIFAFGIAGLMYHKIEHAASGFVAGLSLFLGLIVSLLLLVQSSASAYLNPAVAFGLGGIGLTSIIGPVIGSVIGMWIYSYLHQSVKEVARNAVSNAKSL